MATPNISFGSDDPASIELATRKMYARVLSQWAMDLMQLRMSGMDVPRARAGDELHVMPARNPENLASLRWSQVPAVSRLKWKAA
jgi:hypothetical protein